ncbi:type II secretion system secretin GspD [Lampropedia puyangensis]|uniref:type II secretion system secretin GspD n=1 Tax=Lampropedia puyangensis TaxID=1330072 RepID=UPI0013053763|nr:type II secretion system secretin GspD [Lampropedia puyangensis]
MAFSQAACTQVGLQADSQDQALAVQHGNSEDVQSWQGTVMNVAGDAPLANPALGESKKQGTEDDTPPEPKIRIYEGTGVTLNPPKRSVALAGEAGEFNFEEAPITEVVHVMMGEILKADYVLHQPITGTLTLSTRKAVSKDTAMSLLETALLANGLLIAQDSRGFYHIGKPESLRGIVPAPRMAGASYGPLPPGYGIVLMPLEFIGAAEMAEILKPVMTENSLLRVDPIRNMLVLAGTRPQAEGWLDLAKTFDVDMLKGMSVGIFPLKYATVSDVQAALQLVAGGTSATESSPAGGAAPGQQGNLTPQQRAAQQRVQQQTSQVRQQAGGAAGAQQSTPASPQVLPVLGSLRVVPLERLNSLMVITPRSQYLEQVKTWIERLDQPNDSTEPQLFVYPVQNGSAAHLAQVLGGIFGGSSAGGTTANTGVAPGLGNNSMQSSGFNNNFSSASNRFGSSAGFGGSSSFGNTGTNNNQQNTINTSPVAMDLGTARVIADPLNNAILVWGTRPEFERIEATLKRLDKQPVQVLLEASIVEVKLTNDLQYGLRWAFNGGVEGYRGEGGSPSLAGLAPAAAVQQSLGGGAFTYALSKGERVAAMLQMLASRSLAKMLSSPSLLVLDNHTAAINVGDQIPVAVQTNQYNNTTNGNTSTNYQYRDTGLALQITPSVNAGDLVTLTVDQNLSDIGSSNYAGGNPSFTQRQVSSKVAVKSGEPIVLGGLIKENTNNNNEGIPGLVDIPVARHAFGSTTNKNERTELLVIITPTVIRSNDELRDAGNELRDRMQDLMRTRVEEIKRGGPVLPGEEDLVDLIQSK